MLQVEFEAEFEQYVIDMKRKRADERCADLAEQVAEERAGSPIARPAVAAPPGIVVSGIGIVGTTSEREVAAERFRRAFGATGAAA